MQNRKIKLKGIAMVEAMIAISIIMIGVLGPMLLANYSAKKAKLTLNRITATYIGEEQIEMMINYKKSLDIYCFNNINNCDNSDSFDEFYNAISYGNVNCGTPGLPCFVDENSFIYNGINKPTFAPIVDIAGCRQLYTLPDDIATCNSTAPGAELSPFTRKLIIQPTDYLKDFATGALYPNAVKLTSVVCIAKPTCEANDKDSVTLVYHIYK